MASEETGAQSDKWLVNSDHIMAVAKVIWDISEDLEEKTRASGGDEEQDPEQRTKAEKKDTFLGAFYLGPALTALGIEFALKALQCRVREGAFPDREHDLLKLFQKLPEEIRTQLEEAWAEREWPRGEMSRLAYLDMTKFEDLVMPRESRLEEVLKAHREVFTKWRYGYELLGEWYGRRQDGQSRRRYEFGEHSPQMAALRDALKTIMATYCRRPGRSVGAR